MSLNENPIQQLQDLYYDASLSLTTGKILHEFLNQMVKQVVLWLKFMILKGLVLDAYNSI